jgi:chromosomal replication initiation ATPase DnaA
MHYSFDNFLEGDSNRLAHLLVWLLPQTGGTSLTIINFW